MSKSEADLNQLIRICSSATVEIANRVQRLANRAPTKRDYVVLSRLGADFRDLEIKFDELADPNLSRGAKLGSLARIRREFIDAYSDPTKKKMLQQVEVRNKEPRFAASSALSVVELMLDAIDDVLQSEDYQSRERPEDIVSLRSSVPPQRVAPIYCEVKEGRLVVDNRKNSIEKPDETNVAHAREHLVSVGSELLVELKKSNVDRRLIDVVARLNEQVATDANIVAIGLQGLTCQTVCAAFKEELSDAVNAQISAYAMSVELYVAQFPQWQQFSANAATVELSPTDLKELQSQARDVSENLRKQPELVDPEIPRILLHLSELVHDPSNASKRAAFALIRSLQNIVGRILEFGIRLLSKTEEKTIEKLSTHISVTVIALFYVAIVTSFPLLGSLVTKIPELRWLKPAIEVVQRELDHIESKTPPTKK